MREFIDKTETQNGTPLNRDYLMAVQGMDSQVVTVSAGVESGVDFVVEEYNTKTKQTLTTKFYSSGKIEEIFVGEKTIKKTTTYFNYGNLQDISEVIS